jgi:hypothetical protein
MTWGVTGSPEGGDPRVLVHTMCVSVETIYRNTTKFSILHMLLPEMDSIHKPF